MEMSQMEVNAIAYLDYRDGEEISSGWERLRLIVKFKEKGKFFKVRLVKNLASTYFVENPHQDIWNRYGGSYDKYYEIVENYIGNEKKLKGVAENLILDYFKNNKKNNLIKSKSKEVADKVANSNKIEVKVKIK
jgi:hypothetical protein